MSVSSPSSVSPKRTWGFAGHGTRRHGSRDEYGAVVVKNVALTRLSSGCEHAVALSLRPASPKMSETRLWPRELSALLPRRLGQGIKYGESP